MDRELLNTEEFLVAIRTGSDYWHILSRREMRSIEAAEKYASRFSDNYDTTILKVRKVIPAKLNIVDD
jgi:hypothetical protein